MNQQEQLGLSALAEETQRTTDCRSTDAKKMYDISIVAIAKNEGKYLAEWLAYHYALGFNHIYLYDNDSTDETAEIIAKRELSSFVTRIHWPRTEHSKPQPEAYDDWLKRYSHLSEWVITLDLDEFFVPLKHNSVREFLAEHDDKDAIGINWRMFGDSGHKTYHPDLLMNRFQMAALQEYGGHYLGKTFARASKVRLLHIHTHLLQEGSRFKSPNGQVLTPYPACRQETIDFSEAQINHYYTKSAEEWDIKRSRGKADHVVGSKNHIRDAAEFLVNNKNDVLDTAIQRFNAATNAVLLKWRIGGNSKSLARLPKDIYHVLAKSPRFSEALIEGLDNRHAYDLVTLLSSYTRTVKSAKFERFECFSQVSFPFDGIESSNEEARIFISSGSKIKNLKIVGTGTCIIFIGKNCSISDTVIAANGKICIVAFGHTCRIEGLFIHSYNQIGACVLGPGTTTQAGNNFCIQENSYIVTGEDCMLSTNVFMRTSDSHGIYDAESRERINYPAPIVLHDHTWISRACSLNKGTEVGPGVIIAQGSVASGILNANSIYSGSPTRFIKSGVLWDRKLIDHMSADHVMESSHFIATFETDKKYNIGTSCNSYCVGELDEIEADLKLIRFGRFAF